MNINNAVNRIWFNLQSFPDLIRAEDYVSVELPKKLRDEIWRTYRPGQEIAQNPSPEYVMAVLAAQKWFRSQA